MRHSLKRGDYVQSHYRARWYGIIMRMDDQVAKVLVTHDKSGRPQRKQFMTSLHSHWLSKYETTGEWKEFQDEFKEAFGIQ